MHIADKIAAADGRPSGFDYMRLLLALSVIFLHSFPLSYGRTVSPDAPWFAHLARNEHIVVPMFFALSGFLVAGSLERSRTLGMFLGLRAIRIYPALFVEIVLSAFILGPIFTTVSLSDYFSGKTFWLYLLNVTGDVHYLLPGVFAHNPIPYQVNTQLWTVPYEFLCYFAVPAISLLGIMRRHYLAPLAAAALMAVWLVLRLHGHVMSGHLVHRSLLLVTFLCGLSLYFYRDKVRWSPSLFGLCVALAVVLPNFWEPAVDLVSLPIAYLTVFLGVTMPKRIFVVRGADYSYGIYLYGAVVQQAFASLGDWTHHWYLNFLVCAPASAAFAALSWRFIERPALKFRDRLAELENGYLAWVATRRPIRAPVT